MTIRNPRMPRPLLSAMRIIPMAVATPLVSHTALAATIRVTDTFPYATVGSCSIVDAVRAINSAGNQLAGCNSAVNVLFSNVSFGVDEPFGVNDTIDLTAFVSPTEIAFEQGFNLGQFQSALVLTAPAIISGNAANGIPLVTLTRVPGAPDFRLIETNSSLVLSGVNLTHGAAPGAQGGGAIANTVMGSNATLAVTNSLISGNTASGMGGGIAWFGSDVTVNNSRISNNIASGYGGGIYHFNAVGIVSINHSTIDKNRSSGSGGGVETFGHINVSDSTISDNLAEHYGGGIATTQDVTLTRSTVNGNVAYFSGGGVGAVSITASNSTFSGNSAGTFGGAIKTGSAHLAFTTITDNATLYPASGGGIFFDAPNVFAIASLIWGNSDLTANPSPDDMRSSANAIVTGSFNLVGAPGPTIVLPGDTRQCDPQLGPLADNGGPTLTHAVAVTSCAVDAGPATAAPETTDQRGAGFARPVGIATDIGAYESSDPIFKNGFE